MRAPSERRLEGSEGLVDLRLGDDEWRQEAEHVRSGGEDEQACVAAGVDDRAGVAVEHRREQQPAAAHLAHGGEGLQTGDELGAPRATFASSSSSIASTTAHAAAAATGFPPNVDPWSPGPIASAAPPRTSSAPIGSPFPSPFASVTRSGSTPSPS